MLKQKNVKSKIKLLVVSNMVILLVTAFVLIATDVHASDPVVGTWNWIGGQTLIVSPNQTQSISGKWGANDGIWVRSGGTRTYIFSYSRGKLVDTVTLSTDGNTLAGTNNQGAPVSGTRRN